MNISDQNNLTYDGHVKIFFEQYGKKQLVAENHNNGTDYLFTFITNCLAGYWSNVKYLAPGRIKLIENDATVLGGFDSGTMYSSAPVASGNSVKFHFRIPSLYFTKAHKIVAAKLYNLSGSTELASVDLPAIEIPVEQTNLTIIVDWTLTIENKTTNN